MLIVKKTSMLIKILDLSYSATYTGQICSFFAHDKSKI